MAVDSSADAPTMLLWARISLAPDVLPAEVEAGERMCSPLREPPLANAAAESGAAALEPAAAATAAEAGAGAEAAGAAGDRKQRGPCVTGEVFVLGRSATL